VFLFDSGGTGIFCARLDSDSLISWERSCKEKSPYCYVTNLRELFAGNQGEPY
jgi:hypothetical protein